MEKKTLEQLCKEHSGKLSDKWELYLTEYERLLYEYRDRAIALLEIGVQNGGSLEIWSKYFPVGRKFVGCDINPDCAMLKYEDPRIAVVVGDANTDAAQAQVLGHSPAFDIIVDDGSHCSSDIVKSFARYFPYLSDGGVFIAEDLHCSYWSDFEGGLAYPLASIEFFKGLADIVNYEHWGNEKSRAEILQPFISKYGVPLPERLLQQVHSVEFINSICIVRKAQAERNRLGARVISGSEDKVVKGLRALNATQSDGPPKKARRFFGR